jgi:hypothetical protein
MQPLGAVAGWTLFAVGWLIAIGHRVLEHAAPGAGWLASGLTAGLAGAAAVACFLVGSALIIRVRKRRATNAEELMRRDQRPPVLYLRFFADDGADVHVRTGWAQGHLQGTVEEQLALAMRAVGPFVAIGQPGEALPELGAARLYVAHNAWQAMVLALAERARLVVFRVGTTPGFWWEVEQMLTRLPPERVLVFFPDGTQALYPKFRATAEARFKRPLPAELGTARFIHFDAAAAPSLIVPKRPALNRLGRSAIEATYFEALRPVFARLGVPQPRPSFPLVYSLGIAGAAGFAALIGATAHLSAAAEISRAELTRATIHWLRQRIELQQMQSGAYLPADTLLCLLGVGPRCDAAGNVLDGWGRPIRYRVPGVRNPSSYDLYSLGSDGAAGGTGAAADIGNW